MSLNGGRGSTVAGLEADWSRPEISKTRYDRGKAGRIPSMSLTGGRGDTVAGL